MHTPDLLPAEGLGVYWLVDVLVEDKEDKVVKDNVDNEDKMGNVDKVDVVE